MILDIRPTEKHFYEEALAYDISSVQNMSYANAFLTVILQNCMIYMQSLKCYVIMVYIIIIMH